MYRERVSRRTAKSRNMSEYAVLAIKMAKFGQFFRKADLSSEKICSFYPELESWIPSYLVTSMPMCACCTYVVLVSFLA